MKSHHLLGYPAGLMLEQQAHARKIQQIRLFEQTWFQCAESWRHVCRRRLR